MHITKQYLKLIKKLSQKKYRNKFNKYIIETYKVVEQALLNNAKIESIIYSNPKIKNLISLIKSKNIKLFWISEKELSKLSHLKTTDGILAIVEKDNIILDEGKLQDIILILDNIKDPGNLGTIIRICDWFGIRNLILSKNSVDPYNEKVLRSTMGSNFNVNIFTDIDLFDLLNKIKEKFFILGTSLQAELVLQDFLKSNILKQHKNIAVIFGNESSGIQKGILNLCNKSVHIEKFGRAESLNVAVSVGILIYELKNYER